VGSTPTDPNAFMTTDEMLELMLADDVCIHYMNGKWILWNEPQSENRTLFGVVNEDKNEAILAAYHKWRTQ